MPNRETTMRIREAVSIVLLVACLIRTVEWGYSPQTLTTIQVPQAYHSIQEAIDAAAPGDTIHVSAGIYNEELVINKSIKLMGEDWSNTFLNGTGTDALVDILADNVTLSGFTLCNCDRAVVMTSVSDCEIRENFIANSSWYYYGLGIHAINCRNVTIRENLSKGIYWNHVFFDGTRESSIINNTFFADLRFSQPVFLYYSDDNVVGWNEVSGVGVVNEGGIGVVYSNRNVICYNDIVENDWAGVSLRYSNDTIVEGNTIKGHEWWGLRLTNCRNSLLFFNNFIANGQHVHSGSCENTTWSRGNYGNYWDDYGGKDTDDDGIGNEPYIIDAANNDTHALMGEFHYFRAQKQDQKVPIIVISNSTVNSLTYLANDTSPHGELDIQVSGNQATNGFCLLMFPRDFIEPPYNVTVNGVPPQVRDLSTDQETALYFAYLHQKPQESIIVLGEFPNLCIFVAMILLQMAVMKALRRHMRV